jgi:hypothetical protein
VDATDERSGQILILALDAEAVELAIDDCVEPGSRFAYSSSAASRADVKRTELEEAPNDDRTDGT